MDERLRKSLLFDFYGELLSEHQKSVYTAAIFDDMSYSELAEEFGCTRQAAFDLVRRTTSKLEDYEKRLGLLKRFTEAREKSVVLTESLNDLKELVLGCKLDDKTRKNIENHFTVIADEAAQMFETF